MQTKYFNISFNMKKIIFLISFLYLISSTAALSNIKTIQKEKEKESRKLQYSLGSIYYELQYPLNNLTGTGDRLKDVPYKVQCKILACASGCCVGEIDNMSCGPAADCAIYLDALETNTLIIAVCVAVVFLIIFAILFITFKKIYKFSISASTCLALGCMTIFLIPCVIWFVCKERKNVTSDNNKSKDG